MPSSYLGLGGNPPKPTQILIAVLNASIHRRSDPLRGNDESLTGHPGRDCGKMFSIRVWRFITSLTPVAR